MISHTPQKNRARLSIGNGFGDDLDISSSSYLSNISHSFSPGGIESVTKNLHQSVDEKPIKVITRIKPDLDSIIDSSDNTVTVDTGKETLSFMFDKVFDFTSQQQEIYDYSIKETVDDVFKGYNGTILAYGQTGSGKSYTMLGPDIEGSQKGIIPRIADEIFQKIRNGDKIEYTLTLSVMEIHLDQINDLLVDNPKLSIHEDKEGVYVKGLSSISITNAFDLYNVIKLASKHRKSHNTNMNIESSRSHAIFEIKLKQNLDDLTKTSRLFLIDLAGSEKVDRTGAFGQTLKEARNINSSLSTLGNVINALNDRMAHVPYRDSKLTRILQESLGGNSHTTLILNISPSKVNELETLSTLRFGSRAKNIKNHAHINKELSVEELKTRLDHMIKLNEKNRLYIESLEKKLAISDAGIPRQDFNTPVKVLVSPRLSDSPSRTPVSPSGFSPGTNTSSPTASRIPISPKYSESRIPSFNFKEKLLDKDNRIKQLEQELLSHRTKTMEISNDEEIKLNILEKSLNKLNQKLKDVEIININLRKHLMINERLIDQKQETIDRLNKILDEQNKVNLEEKLYGLRERLEPASPRSGLDLKIIRPIIGGEDSD
ncbi:putative kinesin-like protein 3 [[Candida] jaroonii]|uniref:Kinesin-like protein 3 n=1 Tax=[Candida] jaroonii TaxID=467808 RepID=A0ACA9Y7Y6_9ASCO|nr:putative kinesin-like protein 3 [[Candida] jaroonii]